MNDQEMHLKIFKDSIYSQPLLSLRGFEKQLHVPTCASPDPVQATQLQYVCRKKEGELLCCGQPTYVFFNIH